jgi:glutamate dehydrogenase (NAD(P)+)
LERLTRRYASEILPFIGPEKDVPAPDVNTDERVMGWIMDTYSMNQGYSVPGIVTGKPLAIGGSMGRGGATSRGVLVATQCALKHMSLQADGLRVAIQGFGKVGGFAAQLFHDAGFNVIAVSDYKGGVYNPRGLNPTALMRYKAGSDTIAGFPGADALSNEELLELDCDLLIPAALEDQITEANADRIRARIIVEAANGPTTPEADHLLNDKGVLVVPDILANAGGVTVSYFEWVQDIQAYFWTEDEVNARMREVMVKAYENVRALAEERQVRLRLAALSIGIGRVAEAHRVRGLYP